MKRLNDLLPYLLTAALTLIIYLLTLAPDVIQIDAGELAAVQATAGIAHPTGYPSFTVIGYLFSKLPIFSTVIYRLNFLALLFCLIGVLISLRMYMQLAHGFTMQGIRSASSREKTKKKQKQAHSNAPAAAPPESFSSLTVIIASVVATLFLAFSKTFWFQSTSVEVYSLHILYLSILLFLLVKARMVFESGGKNDKYWYVFAIALAFAFSNHLTTLLILPGTAYLFFTERKFSKKSFLFLTKMIGIFLPVLLAWYAYLPLRSSASPVLNWGNPQDWEYLMRHISGKQYQVWIFSSFDSAGKQFTYFINNLSAEYTIGFIPVVAGLYVTYRYNKNRFFFFLINIVATVLYAINYDISDIDSYFLLAYISMGAFGVFGAGYLIHLAGKKNLHTGLAATGLALAIILHIGITFLKNDQSNTLVFRNYTRAVLETAEKEAIILSYQWDYFISASYYYQFVEGVRKDVAIVDKELLRRSWYYNQLETAYPWVMQPISTESQLFQRLVQPFERSEPYDPAPLERSFRSVITQMIEKHYREPPVYLAPEMIDNELQRGELELPANDSLTLVPMLFSYKVTDGKAYVPAPDPDFSLGEVNLSDRYQSFIFRLSASVLLNRIRYELDHNMTERAKVYADKLKKDFSTFAQEIAASSPANIDPRILELFR